MKLSEILADFPMIAAVRNEEDLRECFKTQCRIIFVIMPDRSPAFLLDFLWYALRHKR